jgi:hypothetical protein
MVFRKPAKRRPRFLLAALAAGIVLLGGSISATGASAATQAGAAATTHQDAPAPSHVAFPSYYVTPAGQRLSVAEVDADAETPAASVPVYYISSSNEGLLTGIHACEELGSYKGTQGIVCADLYASINSSGGVSVQSEEEGYCQGSAGYVECASIAFVTDIAVAAPSGTDVYDNQDQACGHTLGACLSGRNYFRGTVPLAPDGCNTAPGDGSEFWTTIVPDTGIELPGDVDVVLTGNLSSPHAIVVSASC